MPELEAAEPEPEVARPMNKVIEGRAKHSRKRKTATQEADKPEPEMTRIIDTLVL